MPSVRLSRVSQSVIAFFGQPRNAYWFGLVFAIAASLIELLRGRAENFVDYSDATHNFWQGISSYTTDYASAHDNRYFIYTPVFNVFFTPFAYLPPILGGLLWSVLGYSAFFRSVMMLPEVRRPMLMFMFLLLTLLQSIFCFQFNVWVAAIFLLAFALMERGRFFWAVVLIAFSAVVKVYGIVEFGLLLCYPKFWRHLGWALASLLFFLILPATHLGLEGVVQWYQDWMAMLSSHTETTGVYYSAIFAWPFSSFALEYLRPFQLVVLLPLVAVFLCCRKRWTDLAFRKGVLAVLMGYIVVMSEAAEYTTYTIALSGYALWYFSRPQKSQFDRILFWILFVLWCVAPIDLFVPSAICNYLHKTLWLGVYAFLAAWIRIIWTTAKSR